MNDGLFVFEFAHNFPETELLDCFHVARSVVEDDEAFDAQAFHQDLSKTREGGILLGIARDQAAEDNAAVKIHAVENGVHDFAADIFKINVHTFGSGRD